MKQTLLLFLFLQCMLCSAFSQYWQQQVDYTIDVTLDDQSNTLSAFEKLIYSNHSPDTLTFIWFHLWPNAYKNDRTAYTDQDLLNGSTKFYFSDKEAKGYINQLDFKVDNITAATEDHPHYIDVIKVILPKPLLPGQSVTITTPFHVKLPFNFSRGGHDGQSYQATQWYPKPAVYDQMGWHPMPYLDQGEFYSEYGSFDVRITVPRNYVIAATGLLQDADEKKWLMDTRPGFNWTPVKKKELMHGQITTSSQEFPESDKEMKTVHFRQDRIHDFAWFADKRFIMQHDTCQLASGRVIDVYSFFTPKYREGWSNSVNDAKRAIRHYSSNVGEYPYDAVKVVQGPESFGGGMEYPMITVISPTDNPKDLEKTIVHEVGHNWFYGILGSNERDNPWMDEGINTFYEQRYEKERFGDEAQLERILFETQAVTKQDQPIALSSDKFSELNYNVVVYYKTAEWLRYIESELGRESFDKAMKEYYNRWQFRHPQPADLKKMFEEASGKSVDNLFAYINKKGTLPNQTRSGTRAAFVFDFKSLVRYAKHPSKDLILFGPAVGANSYDKLMAGLFVTNLKLPPSKFQFLFAPMYATGTKSFAGIGFAYYSFYPSSVFSKVEVGLNASKFTIDKFTQEDGSTLYPAFHKIVPGIKFTFREKDPRSSSNKFIQFRTYLVEEGSLRFYRDTIINGIDTTILNKYKTIAENRTLNQLRIVIENNRVLYPYSGELKIEQGKYFVRAGFTGKYYFNYVKEGGLDVRVFAGKFIYTGAKTFTKQFATDRYHLNLTGPNGYEDYTYSDYFAGRNRFEGWTSQQIMVRDGAFKVRTDLLADKVGKTDDWLAAVNLGTTIPRAINPLSMLPVKIPLKLFVDIGTYADAWKQNSDLDRFVFDAGIQIPVFKETINIYVPLIYSGVFKDYIQSTLEKKKRFWQKISFSIDISNFSLRRFDRNLNF